MCVTESNHCWVMAAYKTKKSAIKRIIEEDSTPEMTGLIRTGNFVRAIPLQP